MAVVGTNLGRYERHLLAQYFGTSGLRDHERNLQHVESVFFVAPRIMVGSKVRRLPDKIDKAGGHSLPMIRYHHMRYPSHSIPILALLSMLYSSLSY
jgi:hypothetical protein